MRRRLLVFVFTALVFAPLLAGAISIDAGLRAELLSLFNQLTAINLQLEAIKDQMPNGGHRVSAIIPARNLARGSRGEEVRQLQEALIALGFLEAGNNTGYFGPLTRAAVIAFQEAYASEILAPLSLAKGTGFFGPATRAKLAALLNLRVGLPSEPSDNQASQISRKTTARLSPAENPENLSVEIPLSVSSVATTTHRGKNFSITLAPSPARSGAGGNAVPSAVFSSGAASIAYAMHSSPHTATFSYAAVEKGLKETITLPDKTAPFLYVFTLNLTGIDYYTKVQDNWYFFDALGKAQFVIPKGFMTDANGARSEDVAIAIEKNDEGEDILTISADSKWLSDSTRVYPVQIDPTTLVETGVSELVASRERDAKYFAVSSTTIPIRGDRLHYRATDGSWQNTDLTFHFDGARYASDRNDIHRVFIASRALSIVSASTGAGIQWLLPNNPMVSGRATSYTDDRGIVWKYVMKESGVKLAATIARAQGAATYRFPFTLIDNETITTAPDGSLQGKNFFIPRAYAVGANGARYVATAWRIEGNNAVFDFDDSLLPPSAFPYILDPSTFTQSDYRWYENVNALQPSAALADENIAATITATTSPVRLRTSVVITNADLPAASTTLKLQYAYQTSGPWTDVATTSPFGTGVDGAVTINSAVTMGTSTIASGRSYADGIAYRINPPADGATSVGRYLANDTISNGIATGDEVLLINLQGASGDTADVGNYEFMQVDSVTASTTTFTTAITKSYNGTTAANQKVVIQRVPQYTDVTLSGSGSLYAAAWDALATTPSGVAGYYTGIIAFRANGTVTVGSGTSITASNAGYRGQSGGGGGSGGSAPSGTGSTGSSGGTSETISGVTGNAATGGTGGVAGSTNGGGGGGSGAGGTGGSYAVSGTAGTSGTNGGNAGGGASKGSGGSAVAGIASYGDSNLSVLYFGSSGHGGAGGGGGGGGSSGWPGRAGGNGSSSGNGGGIIVIGATNISMTGIISANGSNGSAGIAGLGDTGGGGGGGGSGGGGGGGAGGSIIILSASSSLGANLATSIGGSGGNGGTGGNGGSSGSAGGGGGGGGNPAGSGGCGTSTCGGAGTSGNNAGGAGGNGRIYINYVNSLSGTTNPSASTTLATTTAWSFYNNSNVVNNSLIPGTLLSNSSVRETYQEASSTAPNQNPISVGQAGEWDFVLNPQMATSSTTYYFRLVKSDGTALDGYTRYPTITVDTGVTAAVPVSIFSGADSTTVSSGGRGDGGSSGGGGSGATTGATTQDSGARTDQGGGGDVGGGSVPISTNWWNTSWLYRQKITCGGQNAPASNLGGGTITSGFPCRVTLTSGTVANDAIGVNFSNFKADAGTGIGPLDLCFVSGDQTTVLNHEVEVWNSANTDQVCTGANCATVWVGVPTVTASAGTAIWLYYGNSSATSCGGTVPSKTGVWGSYLAVYHLAAATDSADSLGGTDYSSTDAAGAAGRARSFSSASTYIDLGKPAALNIAGTETVELWIKPPTLTAGTNNYFFADFNSGGTIAQFGIRIDGTPLTMGFYQKLISGSTTNFNGTATVSAGTWYAKAVVRNDSAKTVQLYHNGGTDGSATSYSGGTVVSDTTSGNKAIGRAGDYSAGSHFPGTVDEVRISTTALTTAAIKAGYDSMRGAFNIGAGAGNAYVEENAPVQSGGGRGD